MPVPKAKRRLGALTGRWRFHAGDPLRPAGGLPFAAERLARIDLAVPIGRRRVDHFEGALLRLGQRQRVHIERALARIVDDAVGHAVARIARLDNPASRRPSAFQA